MVLIVAVLIGLFLVEYWLSQIKSAQWRKSVGSSTMFLLVSLSVSLLVVQLSLFTILVCLITVFRLINISRLLRGQKQPDYLANIFSRSALWLVVTLLCLFLVHYLIRITKLSNFSLVAILLGFQFVCAVVLALGLIRSYRKMKIVKSEVYIKDQDLPSLSVAIPARNETMDLEECLNSLVASDYPKLEILVLDDCSQTKHTPEIIKSYAQAGVRFIKGEVPPDSWTAKNYAYQQLTEQSSSELLLFCGVDVRFQPDTLRLMVEAMVKRKKKMISFMPLNIDKGLTHIQKLAVQPWRYFWEMALPRRQLNRPAVLSTCWLIYPSDLKEIGGFKAVSRDILPERYFARQIIKKGPGFAFLRTAGSDISFVCHKDYSAQLSTAKRTLYPLLGSRLESVLIVSVLKTIILVLPFALFVYGPITGNAWLALVSYANLLILGYSFQAVTKITYGHGEFGAIIFMPFLAVFDIYQTIKSMWLYEFREVIWKDRNVCIPAMRVMPSQPVANPKTN